MKQFIVEYTKQVELGIKATDVDYVLFQRTINANVRGAAKIRHGILLRKLLRSDPSFVELLDPTVVVESGVSADILRLGESIGDLIEKINTKFFAKTGSDLIKPTNKTLGAIRKIGKPVRDYAAYGEFISNLYFVFWEGMGQRLQGRVPDSFKDINLLRTDLQHDVDHGKAGVVAAKRKAIAATFSKYVSATTPETVAPEHFPIFQASLMGAIEKDLRGLLAME